MRPLSIEKALITTRVPRKTIDVSSEKHAANPLSKVVRAIRADGAGTLVCRYVGDSADRTYNVVAGEVIQGEIKYVRASSTATGLIGYV